MSELPLLYSFRRCPYAIRARLALSVAGVKTQLREIVLRDKPAEMLEVSSKATVPVLVLGHQTIDESLDIMDWALGQHDPEGWLDMPQEGRALIEQNDGPFKRALDRTKYADRYDGDPEQERETATQFLGTIAGIASNNAYLFGSSASLADMALLPFVRQFAAIDRHRFDNDSPQWVQRWLDQFLQSERFTQVMKKYPKWRTGDAVTLFPEY
ncbi:MAG: glutathione S-transferase [Lysobacterales bacterium]